ncbi:MAG: STAS domain-containing protein [Eubacteriaceae bacterium]|nr:STAS domain-containing protein [Eubacteriaceae bacterium]
MTIEKKEGNGTLTFVLKGRLDTSTAPELQHEIDTCLNGVKELSFEISGLEYLSSAGLRTLLSAQKTMNGQGTMKVLHPKDSVMEIFEITGFTDILTIIK